MMPSERQAIVEVVATMRAARADALKHLWRQRNALLAELNDAPRQPEDTDCVALLAYYDGVRVV